MSSTSEQRDRASKDVGRRAIIKGAAWSIPVIAAAAAAPVSVASGAVEPAVTWIRWSGYTTFSATNQGGGAANRPGQSQFVLVNGKWYETGAVWTIRPRLSDGQIYTGGYVWNYTVSISSSIGLVFESDGNTVASGVSSYDSSITTPGVTLPLDAGPYSFTLTFEANGVVVMVWNVVVTA